VPAAAAPSARVLVRALRRSVPSCPSCGSDRLRPSRRPYGSVATLAGLRAWRCRECGLRFPLRARVTQGRREAARPPSPRGRRQRRERLVRLAYAAVLALLVLGALLVLVPWRSCGVVEKKWKPPAGGAQPWR